MSNILKFPVMANKPTDHLPNRIRYFRQRRRLTLQDLAEMIGTSRVQLCRLELGQRPMTVDWLDRVGRALDIPVADLLSKHDNPWGLTDGERDLIYAVRAAGGASLDAVTQLAETMRSYTPQPMPDNILPYKKLG